MDTECVKVTFNRVSLCIWKGYPTNYTVGDMVLTGNTPRDNSWDGKTFKIKGHVVQNEMCTMLFVDKATPCQSAVPTSST